MPGSRRRTPLVSLPPWPPTPDGSPLTVVVPCTTDPGDDAPAARHDVVLGPDWDVHTPHDLDAERVAAAFGSYSSCLRLVDHVVPAVRDLVQLRARRLVPAMRRGSRGTWTTARAASARCCRPRPSASQAAEHLRSVEHASAAAVLPEDSVSRLLEAVLAAHGAAGEPRLPRWEAARAAGCVRRGLEGVASLWRAGLHPDVVLAVHAEVGTGPLPEVLYLGAVSGRPDLAWVADTLVAVGAAARDDPDDGVEGPDALADWLVWTQTSARDTVRAACTAWLVLGVPRTWVPDLVGSGYDPDAAKALAAGTGLSEVGAVCMLRRWVEAGCRPAVPDLLGLLADGVPAWYSPSAGAVRRLVDLGGDGTTTTEAGLALARHGTVVAAQRALAARATREVCA